MQHYLIQIIVFQLLFLLVYELFLKKETFFTYNRAYLLVTPVIAMLLPLLKIPVLQTAIPAETLVMLPEVFIGGSGEVQTGISSNSVTPEAAQSINWWLLAYGAGFLFSLGIFFHKFRILKQLFSYQTVVKTGEMKIVEVPQSTVACTFYNTIFLGTELSKKEREQILSHEMVHVRQRHTLDLLFFELLKLIFWFNPLIYIYQSRISTVHEFLADSAVVKNVEKRTYFEQLLNSAFNTEDISFINQFFNHSLIKKRIVMLQKSRSKSTSKFKFLIILPLMLAMLTYVACTQDENLPEVAASGELIIKVKDLKKMSQEEKEIFSHAFSQVMEEGTHEKLIITDGVKNMEFTVDPVTKGQHAKIYDIEGNEVIVEQKPSNLRNGSYPEANNSGEIEIIEERQTTDLTDVPFAVIDEVPVFPGCESLGSNEARKKCMSEKINQFINSHFDISLGKANGLTGVNRIYVQFKIAEDGTIEVLGARAPDAALEEEARRVINLLPNMTPGKQKGQEVGVLYSLPIVFDAGE